MMTPSRLFTAIQASLRNHTLDPAALTIRRLSAAYIFGLGLLAMVTVVSGVLLLDLFRRHVDHASIINQAGAQRMLSQRIAALAEGAADPRNPRLEWARGEVAAAARRMETSHAALLLRATAPGTGSAGLREHYHGAVNLNGLVADFVLSANRLAGLDSGQAALLAGQLRATALDSLLPILNDAVTLHEGAARDDVQFLKQAHMVALAAALVLMLLEGLFIFRPLVHRTARLAGRLVEEATTDHLTGLFNRRAVMKQLDTLLAAGRPVAAIAIDLDHFKETNDADGHEAGDTVLREAAARLRQVVDGRGIVGRLGGDEFVVLMPDMQDEAAVGALALWLGVALHDTIAYADRVLRLGATLGVAVAPADATDADSLLRAADEALIAAKRRARGTVGRATPEDALRVARAATLGLILKEVTVLPLAGLHAHMQPIISLATGEVAGMEALARFKHDTLGTVPPDEMFATAQRMGVAHLISRQVRADALRAFSILRIEGLAPSRLAINLSAAELLRADVVDVLEGQVEAAGLDLCSITVEITEDAILDRVAGTTLARLAELRGRGARIALDDFGTGTSGLAQLLRIPLDAVKLDGSFTRRLRTDVRAERVVAGAIQLARSLDLTVVAEGVEHVEEAAMLRALGCDLGQGWLWAPAMDEGTLRPWLTARTRTAEVLGLPSRAG